MEIFAGSATFAATARARGCEVVAVDCSMNRHKPKVNLLTRDLLEDGAADEMLELVGALRFRCRRVVVWFAPPCGTASKAREIPLRTRGPAPQPLRSKEYPAGLPHLGADDFARVQAALPGYDRHR